MKALIFSLLGAMLSFTASASADTWPTDLAGSYQVQMYSQTGDTGSPVGLLALKVSSRGAVTGKLTTEDKKVYPVKTTLLYTAGASGDLLGTATHGEIEVRRGNSLPSLFVQMTLKDYGAADKVEAELYRKDPGHTMVGTTVNGFKVKTYAKGETVPTLGTYTVAFELAADAATGQPAGSGYAIGKVDTKGNLKLTGKTGDGTAFTASLPNGEDNQFALFVNPQKRDGCFFAGMIQLTVRAGGGFHMVSAVVGADFQWKKTGSAKDKSYRTSFGPLQVLASAEPWAPAKGDSVMSYLEIDMGKTFPVAFGSGLPSDRTPTVLALDERNNLIVVEGATGSPSTLIGDGWGKFFKAKINVKTGQFSITITLTDKRKVSIEGILLNPVDINDTDEFRFAPGFVLIPPVIKGGEIVSEGIEFQGPPVVSPLAATATAGTYSAVVEFENGTESSPTGAIEDESTVHFTISSDLKSLTFNGKKIPVSEDLRFGGWLHYSNFNTSPTNYIVVQLHLNGTGKVDLTNIIYTQTNTRPPFDTKIAAFTADVVVKE